MALSAPDPDFDARWAAWLARGEAHDATVRRRMRLAIPVVVVLAALVSVFVIG
jgi:hypothetical protein